MLFISFDEFAISDFAYFSLVWEVSIVDDLTENENGKLVQLLTTENAGYYNFC